MKRRFLDEMNAIHLPREERCQFAAHARMGQQPGWHAPFPQHPEIAQRKDGFSAKGLRRIFSDDEHANR